MGRKCVAQQIRGQQMRWATNAQIHMVVSQESKMCERQCAGRAVQPSKHTHSTQAFPYFIFSMDLGGGVVGIATALASAEMDIT
eukprot:1140436-Pelagomonas_calceolata.AAC.3